MSSRATRVALFYIFQAVAMVAALGLVLAAFAAMGSAEDFKERRLCAPLRAVGWCVLPLAFLAGGLINIPGFASAAVLLI